jgi:hypothetical protein
MSEKLKLMIISLGNTIGWFLFFWIAFHVQGGMNWVTDVSVLMMLVSMVSFVINFLSEE